MYDPDDYMYDEARDDSEDYHPLKAHLKRVAKRIALLPSWKRKLLDRRVRNDDDTDVH